jgi:hypothetical protein
VCVWQVYWFGTCGGYNVLVMDLLGDTLENLYNKRNRQFSLKTVLMLAVQLVRTQRLLPSAQYMRCSLPSFASLTCCLALCVCDSSIACSTTTTTTTCTATSNRYVLLLPAICKLQVLCLCV